MNDKIDNKENIKDLRRKSRLEKKKAQVQSMFLDVTKGKGKDTVGGSFKLFQHEENEKEHFPLYTNFVYQTNRRDVLPVNVDLIDINPLNEEFFYSLPAKDWEEFKSDISERGIIQPLLAYQNKRNSSRWMLIDGEQRFKAARELKLKSVPVQVTNKPNNLELERQFIIKANLLRRQLNDEQKQKLYKALSKEERLNFYINKYGKERIMLEMRGGDKKSIKAKQSPDRSTSNQDHNQPNPSRSLKEEILEDTKLSEVTVNRDLADLRKHLKGRTEGGSNIQSRKQVQAREKKLNPELKDKLGKIEESILKISQKIADEEISFKQKVAELKVKMNARVKKLIEQKKIKEKEIKTLLNAKVS